MRLSFAFLTLLFFSEYLQADLIRLKNGESEEGFVFSDEGLDIIIERDGKKKKILKSDIEKVEISYTGIPACYRMKKNSADLLCDDLLHSFDNKKVKFASGKGFLSILEYDLEDLDSVEFKKKYREDISDYLPKDLVLSLVMKKSPVKGKIKAVDKGKVSVSLPDGRVISVNEPDIIGLEYRASENNIEAGTKKAAFEFNYLIPGVAQFRRGQRIKGVATFAIFGMLAFGAGNEYRLANRSLNETQIIFTGETVIFGKNLLRNGSYETHKRNFYALSFLSAVLYLYHLYDSISYKKSDETSSLKISLDYSPAIFGTENRAVSYDNFQISLRYFF